ncbi:hypothetical protein SAMN05660209_01337 [Geodermatophilus africanus]|uniref:Uncharacterized protein n=1 Tax=Geodermatophilus africanus TaxID=1137993 RepID=A0A1H3ERV9_9ACTN|nr:hypothetical protein [Geodermatophilus africanus]SDX81287.1 hypothetical protein SAMN05660209_01337 [Geodermatophilus africanus]
MPTRRARHRARPGGLLGALLHGRTGLVVVGIALLAVLGAAVAALVLGADRADRPTAVPTAPPPGTDSSPSAAPSGPGAALLDWADRALPDGARLRLEDDVRGDLLAAGAPDGLVTTEEPTGPGDVVLTVTRGEPRPGSRVVARFDHLAVVDPAPGTPTPEQLDRRRALAEAVLANPTTHASDPAAAVLRSADVDARLLSLVAVLTAREGVDVAAFPRPDGTDGPARSVLLTAVGGAPVGTGEPATASLTTWLAAQRPPFAPDPVEVTGDGVLLSYRYASDPDDLVAEVSP